MRTRHANQEFVAYLLLIISILYASAVVRAESEPAYYTRKSTWQETLLSSERSLAAISLEDGFETFESSTFRGGEKPQRIEVGVSKAQELWLFVTGCPDVKWGIGNWADAILKADDGSIFSVSSLSNDVKVIEGRCEYNMTLRSGLYDPMRMSGIIYTNGLNVQAYTVLKVNLAGRFSQFQACLGVDDWAGTNGTIRFSVSGGADSCAQAPLELAARDFPDGTSRQQMRWELEDRILEKDWLPQGAPAIAKRYAEACARVPFIKDMASSKAASVLDDPGLIDIRTLYYKSRSLNKAKEHVLDFDFDALRLAIEDLSSTFPKEYPQGAAWLAEMNRLKHDSQLLCNAPDRDEPWWKRIGATEATLESLRQNALLANPLLQFEKLLLIKRKPMGDPRRSQWADRGLGEYIGLPKQSSWHLSTVPKTDMWQNEIAVLSPVRPDGSLSTLYKPSKTLLLTDIDLDFGGEKMLFSMPDDNLLWQVHEMSADGTRLRQLTPKKPAGGSQLRFLLSSQWQYCFPVYSGVSRSSLQCSGQCWNGIYHGQKRSQYTPSLLRTRP